MVKWFTLSRTLVFSMPVEICRCRVICVHCWCYFGL